MATEQKKKKIALDGSFSSFEGGEGLRFIIKFAYVRRQHTQKSTTLQKTLSFRRFDVLQH